MKRIAACCLLLSTLAARADNWPQWRGPNNDGISTEKGLPAEFGPDKNLAWKLPLPGMGSSTPAIWGDKIFLTSESDEAVQLHCISTQGQELWKRKLGTSSRLYRNDEGNDASGSPSTDGKLVFVFIGTGDLAAYDFEGNQKWHFNAQERYGKFRIQWGMHVTPLLVDDRLYLALLHSGGHWIAALDKTTGQEIWKVKRESDATGECKESYASLILWKHGSESYLVVHGNDYTTAHRLNDGGEIWRVGELNPRQDPKRRYNSTLRFVTTPVAVEDLIVIPTAKGGQVVGLKPDANGAVGPGSAFERWRRPDGTPDVPSPLVHEGVLYLCGENGKLICMDARTGKERYQEPLHRSRYRASPLLADGKIYLTARDGFITVVKAGPHFEKLAENRMLDNITASPAVAQGRIYLRGFNALYAIGQGGK